MFNTDENIDQINKNNFRNPQNMNSQCLIDKALVEY